MAVAIVVPQLGLEGQPLHVSLWFVDVGQEVLAGDRLLEVMLPGMTFDISATCNGTLAAIDVREGASIAEGETLGKIHPA